METYLLLRSNKQSGPYTLSQLVNFGLKPYDLIWVEGKSAAWRYPGEVDGLKAYAPAVEEQPFDRFYKKTEESQAVPGPQEKKVNPPSEDRASTSKKVFVSLPENTTFKRSSPVTSASSDRFAKSETVIKAEKPIEKNIENKPIYITEETNEPVVTGRKENKNAEPELSEKYSESLEDIKRRYTETYLKRKKRPVWTSTHTSIARVFGGAVFFCLLVVIVYRNFSGDDSAQLSRTTIIQPNKKDINKTVSLKPTDNNTIVPAVTNKESLQPKVKEEKPARQQDETSIAEEKPVTVPDIQKPGTSIDEKDFAIMTNNPAQKAELPKTEEVKPKSRPVSIRKMVNVRANNYKQLAFGGVKNLELTINNESKFALDRVTVELQYLKPSEQPIKTETVVFNSVEAGDSKTVKIADYTRGVKISYKILDIESTQYDRQTAGL